MNKEPLFGGVWTQADLDKLIEEKLSACSDYPGVCNLLATEAGKKRVYDRINEQIFHEGITNLDTCIANIETEIRFSVEDGS